MVTDILRVIDSFPSCDQLKISKPGRDGVVRNCDFGDSQAGAVSGDQRSQSRPNFVDNLCGAAPNPFREPCIPIDTFDLVRQDDATDLLSGWQRHFERIAFHLVGHRAD
jgi:hypothetical protein